MENDIGLGHLLHPICGERVDDTSQDSKSCHNTNCRVRGDSIVEIRAH